jgi:hypothetical protein
MQNLTTDYYYILTLIQNKIRISHLKYCKYINFIYEYIYNKLNSHIKNISQEQLNLDMGFFKVLISILGEKKEDYDLS